MSEACILVRSRKVCGVNQISDDGFFFRKIRSEADPARFALTGVEQRKLAQRALQQARRQRTVCPDHTESDTRMSQIKSGTAPGCSILQDGNVLSDCPGIYSFVHQDLLGMYSCFTVVYVVVLIATIFFTVRLYSRISFPRRARWESQNQRRCEAMTKFWKAEKDVFYEEFFAEYLGQQNDAAVVKQDGNGKGSLDLFQWMYYVAVEIFIFLNVTGSQESVETCPKIRLPSTALSPAIEGPISISAEPTCSGGNRMVLSTVSQCFTPRLMQNIKNEDSRESPTSAHSGQRHFSTYSFLPRSGRSGTPPPGYEYNRHYFSNRDPRRRIMLKLLKAFLPSCNGCCGDNKIDEGEQGQLKGKMGFSLFSVCHFTHFAAFLLMSLSIFGYGGYVLLLLAAGTMRCQEPVSQMGGYIESPHFFSHALGFENNSVSDLQSPFFFLHFMWNSKFLLQLSTAILVTRDVVAMTAVMLLFLIIANRATASDSWKLFVLYGLNLRKTQYDYECKNTDVSPQHEPLRKKKK